MAPVYDTSRYELHYFYNNFRQLQERFIETDEQEEQNEKEFYQNAYNKEIRSFIPHKVAQRMREVITFSVKLDGRAPDLRIAESTKKKLEDLDIAWNEWNNQTKELWKDEKELFGSSSSTDEKKRKYTVLESKQRWRIFHEIQAEREIHQMRVEKGGGKGSNKNNENVCKLEERGSASSPPSSSPYFCYSSLGCSNCSYVQREMKNIYYSPKEKREGDAEGQGRQDKTTIPWEDCVALAERKAKLDAKQAELQNQYEGYVKD